MAIGDCKTVAFEDGSPGTGIVYYDIQPATGEVWKVTGITVSNAAGDAQDATMIYLYDGNTQFYTGIATDGATTNNIRMGAFGLSSGDDWTDGGTMNGGLIIDNSIYLRLRMKSSTGGTHRYIVSAVQIK